MAKDEQCRGHSCALKHPEYRMKLLPMNGTGESTVQNQNGMQGKFCDHIGKTTRYQYCGLLHPL